MKLLLKTLGCILVYMGGAACAFFIALLPFTLFRFTAVFLVFLFTPISLAISIFAIFAAIYIIQELLEW